jgi:hypothetical protein
MWKTLLKGRHERQADPRDAAPYETGGPPPPKVGYQAPPPVHERNPGHYGYESRGSAGPPVDYRASAPSEQYQAPTSSSFSPWAVDYDRSAPTPQEPNVSTQSATPCAVEYHMSEPTPAGEPSGQYVGGAGNYPGGTGNYPYPRL